jgi:gas vesicle protein
MSTGKVVLGILIGAAAGALLGVLFAPDKGTVTRKKIVSKGEDFADGVKEKINEILESIYENFDKVKKEVSDLTHQDQENAEEVKADLN